MPGSTNARRRVGPIPPERQKSSRRSVNWINWSLWQIWSLNKRNSTGMSGCFFLIQKHHLNKHTTHISGQPWLWFKLHDSRLNFSSSRQRKKQEKSLFYSQLDVCSCQHNLLQCTVVVIVQKIAAALWHNTAPLWLLCLPSSLCRTDVHPVCISLNILVYIF